MKHQDRASVEESRELLAEYMRTLVERASQSGCHLECITGARKALDAMVPLMNAAMESGISNFTRFVFHHRSTPSYPDHQLERQKRIPRASFFFFKPPCTTSSSSSSFTILPFPVSPLRFGGTRLVAAA